jgi:hypothetical protein
VTFVEVLESVGGLSYRQRWSHYFVLIFSVLALLIGVNLRDSTLNATTLYVDSRSGIRVRYPQNWLIDTQGDYVLQVRDTAQLGFTTTIRVSVVPVGAGMQAKNIFDSLSLARLQTLAAYQVLGIQPFALAGDENTSSMSYVYAATQGDPLLQSVPLIVRGLDILTIKRGQAVIVTFLADSSLFDREYPLFQRFLNNLEF